MSDSVRPHRWQPTRLPHPRDSPGKNTGVGCHFLLQCMKVKSESEFAQSCPTLSDPMNCIPPGSSVHGTLQARVLEWGATALSETQIYLTPKAIYFSMTLGFFGHKLCCNAFPRKPLWTLYWGPHTLGSHQVDCVCACSVVQSCPALCDPMDCSPPGPSGRGIS